MSMNRQILWKASLLSYLINCSHSSAKCLCSDFHTTYACKKGFPLVNGQASTLDITALTRYLPFSQNTQGGLKAPSLEQKHHIPELVVYLDVDLW